MKRPVPQTQHNDYVGHVVIDSAPSKQPIEGLLDEIVKVQAESHDLRVIGFEFSVARSSPVLTLFAIHAGDASSTMEAVGDRDEIVQCFTYTIDSWSEGFDELFDRYFDAVHIRVWDDSILGERDVQIIGEQI